MAIATVLLGVGLGLTYGPQSTYYAESFPASVCYSGVSVSYAIGAIFGGAFAPSIAQFLLQRTGTTWSIIVYLLIMVVVSVVGTVILRERRVIPLSIAFENSGAWQDWEPGDPDPTAPGGGTLAGSTTDRWGGGDP